MADKTDGALLSRGVNPRRLCGGTRAPSPTAGLASGLRLAPRQGRAGRLQYNPKPTCLDTYTTVKHPRAGSSTCWDAQEEYAVCVCVCVGVCVGVCVWGGGGGGGGGVGGCEGGWWVGAGGGGSGGGGGGEGRVDRGGGWDGTEKKQARCSAR